MARTRSIEYVPTGYGAISIVADLNDADRAMQRIKIPCDMEVVGVSICNMIHKNDATDHSGSPWNDGAWVGLSRFSRADSTWHPFIEKENGGPVGSFPINNGNKVYKFPQFIGKSYDHCVMPGGETGGQRYRIYPSDHILYKDDELRYMVSPNDTTTMRVYHQVIVWVKILDFPGSAD